MPSSETVSSYRRRGWVKIDQLVSGESLSLLRQEVLDHASEKAPQTWTSGVQAYQGTPEFQHTLRIVRGLMAKYPEVQSVAQRLGTLVRDLEGWRAARFYSDRLFIKPGREFGSKPTKWHQDFPKWPFDRRGAVTVWIAINDVPKTKGPMTFLNGSHRLGPLGAIDQLKDEMDLSEMLVEDDWEVLDGCSTATAMAAGDATIHNALTLHRAGRNVDDEDRIALAFSYFDADALYTGASSPITDGLGLTPYQPFEHEIFPVVA